MTGKSYNKPEGERVNINHLMFVWRIRFYYDTHLLAVYLIFQNTRFRVMQGIDRIIVCPSQSQFPNELSQILHTLTIAKKIHFYKEVGSTQDLAISIVKKKFEDTHGTVIIAERQKNGKGRIDRKWISPKGGVWLSVILKPKIKAAQATLLPIVAALAVCDTINQRTRLNSKIKWPNDIVIEGKKVSGTLVDISIDGKNIEYAVLGIGINANVDVTNIMRYIDTNSRTRALEMTSLKKELSGKKVNIIDLSRILLEKLEYYYLQLEKNYSKRIIHKCRQRSETLNNLVVVEQQNESFECKAIDIDSHGALIVKKSDNNILRIVDGDALVRRK